MLPLHQPAVSGVRMRLTARTRPRRGEPSGSDSSRSESASVSASRCPDTSAPDSIRRRACEGPRSGRPKRRHDPCRVQVPRAELPGVAVAAPHHLVPALRGADVLEARPVGEVAEEVGHHPIGLLLPHHRPAACWPCAARRPSARPGAGARGPRCRTSRHPPRRRCPRPTSRAPSRRRSRSRPRGRRARRASSRGAPPPRPRRGRPRPRARSSCGPLSPARRPGTLRARSRRHQLDPVRGEQSWK